jgi:hypothetical protein
MEPNTNGINSATLERLVAEISEREFNVIFRF